MNHLMCRVQNFEIVGPHTIRIGFDDCTEQTIHFQPVLRGELYGPLSDPAYFERVTLDSEVGTLVWPNGAEFDPATVHEWPKCGRAFVEMASKWELQMA